MQRKKSMMALSCHFSFSIFLFFFFTSLQNTFTSLQQFFTTFYNSLHLFYFLSPFFKFPFGVSFLLPFIIYFTSLWSFLLLLFTIFCTSLSHYFTSLQNFFLLHFSIFKLILFSVSIFLLPFRDFLLPFRVFITLFTYLQ